ncbi:MAG: hypothetical protein RLZ25_943 [Pseudomonadota bacterium]|jgi:hypothetical protein
MNKALICAALLLGGFSPFGMNPSNADDKPRGEDAVTARRNLVEQSMKVDPAKANKFWPLYDKYQKELDHFRKARLELLSSMGENYDNMSESDASLILEQRLKIERGRMELLERTIKEMSLILSKRELARFLQIELKIKAFIDAGIEEEIPILQ